MMKPRRVPTSLQFFSRLRWIDGATPLLNMVEPYRRKLFAEVLDRMDGPGRPHFNLHVRGVAKKNFKSCDLILALLFRLFAWESPGGNQCLIIASDEDQAKDDLELLTKLITANPILRNACRIMKEGVERRDGKGFARVLPKDAAGSHGKTFLYLGIDELHTHQDWSMLEALQADPTRPDVLTWITSYSSFYHRAGAPLFDLFQRGKAGDDPRMLFTWYAADYTTDPAFADASPEDRANPSRGLWEQPDYLEQQRKRLPTVRFRRLHLNLPGFPAGGAYDSTKLDAAVDRGVRIRSPESGIHYRAFIDMSGGSSDAATLAIGYRDGTRRVIAGVWDQGKRPPFNPHDAITRFAAICKQYGVFAVTADTYGRKAPTLNFQVAFQQAGVSYRPCELGKPALYEAFEVPLNAGEVVLPDDPETLEQLAGLQVRGGKIEHRSGEHDDKANAAAGLCWLLGEAGRPRSADEIWLSGARLSAGGPDAGPGGGSVSIKRDRFGWPTSLNGVKPDSASALDRAVSASDGRGRWEPDW